MDRSLCLLFLVLVFCATDLHAQYTWEEVILPETIDVKMIAFDTTGTHYIASNKGVYFSEDSYQWEQTGLSDYVSYIHINKNNTLYAGMNTLFRSFNNGVTWDSIFFCSQGGITSIHTTGDSIICLGTWGGIYRSADSGQTWSHVLFAYNTEVFKSIASNSTGILFSGSTNFSGDYSPGGVYRSDDNGASWALTGLDYHFVSSIVINSKDNLYVGTRGHYYSGSSGIFKSTDDGINWVNVYENNLVATMAINNYDEIAVGCDSQDGYPGGVLCSYDDGANWAVITNNLPLNSFDQVLFRPDNHLYTILHYEDRLFKTVTPVNLHENSYYEVTNWNNIYPNPTKNQVCIKNNKSRFNKVVVSNFAGHMVSDVVIIYEDELIKINVQKLKPGVYFINCSNYRLGNNCYKFIKY